MIGYGIVTRYPLIRALSVYAETGARARALRFLMGLSSDELQFIASYLGAWILELSEDSARAAESLQVWQCSTQRTSMRRTDQENKIILVREFLHVSGCRAALPGDTGAAAS
jgi:hypothetical protein